MNAVFAQAHVVCLPTYYGEVCQRCSLKRQHAVAQSSPLTCQGVATSFEMKEWFTGQAARRQRSREQLSRLLADSELRIAMGRRGREIVEAEFSLEIVIRQTLDIYCEFVR